MKGNLLKILFFGLCLFSGSLYGQENGHVSRLSGQNTSGANINLSEGLGNSIDTVKGGSSNNAFIDRDFKFEAVPSSPTTREKTTGYFSPIDTIPSFYDYLIQDFSKAKYTYDAYYPDSLISRVAPLGAEIPIKNTNSKYIVKSIPLVGYNSNAADSVFVVPISGNFVGENQIKSTEIVSGTHWIYPGTPDVVTTTLNSEIAPNGKKEGIKSVQDVATTYALWAQNTVLVAGEDYVFSIYIKLGDGSSNNLTNLSLRIQTETGITTAFDNSEPREWVRYEIPFTPASSYGLGNYIQLGWTGADVGDSLYMWNPQVEHGSVASPARKTYNNIISTDSILYAHLEPVNGVINIDDVPRNGMTDTELLQAGCDYCNAHPECNIVYYGADKTITSTITKPEKVTIRTGFMGSALTANFSTYGTGTRTYLDLGSASVKGFVFDNESGTGNNAGGGIENMLIIPLSAGRCAIDIAEAYNNNVNNVQISSYPSATRYLTSGLIAGTTTYQTISNTNINDVDTCFNFTGSSTVDFVNIRAYNGRYGMVTSSGSAHIQTAIFEQMDSSAVVFDGNFLKCDDCYVEAVNNTAQPTPAFDIKNADWVVIKNSDINSYLTSNSDYVNIALDDVTNTSIIGNEILKGYSLSTTANTGTVSYIGNTISSSGSFLIDDWSKIADSTEITIINECSLSTGLCARDWMPDVELIEGSMTNTTIDTSHISDGGFYENFLLNAPTAKNLNENIIKSSEAILHATNGYIIPSSGITVTTNDTVFIDGQTVAEKLTQANTVPDLWYTPPSIAFVEGQVYTVSFYVANSKFTQVTLKTGVTASNVTIPLTESPSWVRYSAKITWPSGGDTKIIFSFPNQTIGSTYLHMCGLKIERNPYIGEYIKTTGTEIQASNVNPSLNIESGDTLVLDGTVQVTDLVPNSVAMMSFTDSAFVVSFTTHDSITNPANTLYSGYSYSTGGCITMQGDSVIINCDGLYKGSHGISLQGETVGGIYRVEILKRSTGGATAIIDGLGSMGLATTSNAYATPSLPFVVELSDGDVLKPGISEISGTGNQILLNGQFILEKL